MYIFFNKSSYKNNNNINSVSNYWNNIYKTGNSFSQAFLQDELHLSSAEKTFKTTIVSAETGWNGL